MATVIERDDAIAWVKDITAASDPPEVDIQVGAIVDAAARPDADGNPVEDHDAEGRVWTPTYDLNQAAARVFEVKASHVANRFDVNIDRQGLERSQLYEHFTKLARSYRDRTMGTVPR